MFPHLNAYLGLLRSPITVVALVAENHARDHASHAGSHESLWLEINSCFSMVRKHQAAHGVIPPAIKHNLSKLHQ